MEEQVSSNSLPPFLLKTYVMVDDPSTDSVVSWSPSNTSFVVWNQPELTRDLLPRFFKHNNFSSFIRQLNTYGFRKVDPEKWEFSNEDFKRGQPHLMKNIHRRKPVHSHSLQNHQGHHAPALTDIERQKLKDDMERLKKDKELLTLELQRNEQEHQGLESQTKLLKEQLQRMEHKQQTMVAFVDRALQKPGLALNLVPHLDCDYRKRRLPRICYSHGDVEDNHIGNSQAIVKENTDNNNNTLTVSSDMEQFEQLESSLTYWENIILNVAQAFIEQNSSLDLEESRSCVDRPDKPCVVQLNVDTEPKSPEIDINFEPVSLNEHAVEKTGTVTTGVNDMFWEQFMTENPGSSDAQEVRSDQDSDGKKNESKPGDRSRFWFNVRTVNNLSEQMGHLTHVEKT